MAFEGHESPESARELTGLDILAPRSAAAPLGANEWYVADLVGLALVAGGERLAVVESVLEGGSEPWLEVRFPAAPRGSEAGAKSGSSRLALVPFRREFVGEVDLDRGEIELLAPWLLE